MNTYQQTIKSTLEFLKDHIFTKSSLKYMAASLVFSLLIILMLSPKFLITSDDVENGKPFVDGSKLLISQFTKKYKKIYYVGDIIIDHLFAINSGFYFIEFNNSPNQYILNPRPIVSNLADIRNALM